MNMPDVPECLRRDANNKAPFMVDVRFSNPFTPVHPALAPAGTEIVMIDTFNSGPCTLCAAVESPGFYTGCMVRDGHVPGAQCIDGVISPVASPPASPPCWVPPWSTKT